MAIESVIRSAPVLVTDRTADVHDDHWAKEVYRVMPMGIKSVSKLNTMIRMANATQRIKERRFHWWWKEFEQRITDVTDCYNEPTLTTATSTASASGAVRYLKVSDEAATKWQVGQLIKVTKFADSGYLQVSGSVVGLVTAKSIVNSTDSSLTITLQVADTNNILSGAYLKATPAGQRNADTHSLPETSFEDLVKIDGAMSTLLGAYSFNDFADGDSTRPNYQVRFESMQDALKDLMIDKEMMLLDGQYKDQKDYTSAGGLEYYLRLRQPQTGQQVIDALTDSIYLGSTTGPAYTWIYDLVEGILSVMSETNTEGEYKAVCGPEVGLVLNRFFRSAGTYNLGQTTSVTTYGFKATRLETQHGSIDFMEHPLFKRDPATKGRMVILDPKKITTMEYLPLQHIGKNLMTSALETRARENQDGRTWSSNNKAGFREVLGWKFSDISSMAIVDNITSKVDRS